MRIMLFLTVLFADAASGLTNPLAMAIGVGAYLVLIMPVIRESDRRSR